MKNMSTADFCTRFNACEKGTEWALNYADMHACYDALMRGEAGEDSVGWALWVVTRPFVMSARNMRLFAVLCARRVQHLMRDPRAIEALGVAERYALGKATEDELASTRDAAHTAALSARVLAENAVHPAKLFARAVARDVAVDVARASLYDAAWATLYDAAAAVAWAAKDAAEGAWVAASCAAWNAERAAQVKILAEFGNPFIEARRVERRSKEVHTEREGWTYRINAKVDHYFVDGRSLCGRWLCLGSDFTKTSEKPCAVCKRKLEKRKRERS